MSDDIHERVAEVLCRGVHATRFEYRATQSACDACFKGADVMLEAFPQLAEPVEYDYSEGYLEHGLLHVRFGIPPELIRKYRRRRAGEWEEVS